MAPLLQILVFIKTVEFGSFTKAVERMRFLSAMFLQTVWFGENFLFQGTVPIQRANLNVERIRG